MPSTVATPPSCAGCWRCDLKDLLDLLITTRNHVSAARLLVDSLALGTASPLRRSGLRLVERYLAIADTAIASALQIATRL